MGRLVRTPTKRELGAGYLAGAGIALLVSLVGYLWFSRSSLLAVGLMLTMAVILFSTLVYIAYVCYGAGLEDGIVWSVARWVAVGLGVSVVFATSIAHLWITERSTTVVTGLLVTSIGSWVVLCSLLGVLTGLQSQHRELQALSQRNSVMNRVLRHNIKNAMNVIRGHANLLAENGQQPPDRSVEAINRAVEDVLSLSEAARKIDAIGTTDGGPIDVAALVREYVERVRKAHPEVEITVTSPDTAWVEAGPIVRWAVQNLVENGIDHHEGEQPVRVSITVTRTSPDEIEIEVADNGPGIPQREREIIASDREEPTRHGQGLGLWVIRWIVDGFDGELTFDENQPRGAVVSISLPAAQTRSTPVSGAGKGS